MSYNTVSSSLLRAVLSPEGQEALEGLPFMKGVELTHRAAIGPDWAIWRTDLSPSPFATPEPAPEGNAWAAHHFMIQAVQALYEAIKEDKRQRVLDRVNSTWASRGLTRP